MDGLVPFRPCGVALAAAGLVVDALAAGLGQFLAVPIEVLV